MKKRILTVCLTGLFLFGIITMAHSLTITPDDFTPGYPGCEAQVDPE